VSVPGERSRPKADRLPPDHPRYAEIMARHDAAVAAGDAGYLDPDSGLFVLTAAFLTERGTCCGRGCRHCPYPPDAAPPGVATLS
jgi:hypothetical protein